MVRFGRSRKRGGSLGHRPSAHLKLLQLGAFGAAVLTAGCSADVGRFDFPGSGFADRGATGTLPMPRETVYNSRPTGYLGGNDRVADASPPPAPAPYEPPRASRDSKVQVAALPPPPIATAPNPPVPAPAKSVTAPAKSASRPTPAPQPIRPASAPVEPAEQPIAEATGPQIEVKSGDTLYGLSRRHHVSLNELMKVNGLTNPALKPGQKLVLPATGRKKPIGKPQPGMVAAAPAEAAKPVAPPPGWNATYTIQRGDSLYAIAMRHKIKLAELQKVNGITNVRRVRPGTVIKVPGEAAEAPAVAPIAALPAPKAGDSSTAQIPVASTEAGQQSSMAPAMQPTIINRPKVASLGSDKETMTDTPAAATPAPATAGKATADKVAAVTPGPSTPASSSKLRWPAKGKITHSFGQRPDGTHNDGIDVSVPIGTEVHAAEAGEVAYVGSELKAYGNLVLVRHANGWVTAYAHNDNVLVKRGDKVKRGQVLAKAGKSGQVDQPTVHFELRQGKDPVDPLPFLEKL